MRFMELVDTHCHLTFEQIAPAIEAVLSRSEAAGVRQWVSVGTEPQENERVIELAVQHENLYAAVGIHPHTAKDARADDLVRLRDTARKDKVVAIGETGLDFHYDFSPQPVQEAVFREQLKLAQQLGMPVIIHSRQAFDETVAVLDEFAGGLRDVVFHCFSYSVQQAKMVLERGWHISFTGVLTFKNARRVQEVARMVPLERLMLETDCPYMSPEPMRKQKVNEPAFMVYTAKCLAKLKGMDFEAFCAAVTATSRRFFNLA